MTGDFFYIVIKFILPGLIIFFNNKITKYENHIKINQIIKDEVGEKTIQMMKFFFKKRKKIYVQTWMA